MQDDLPPVDSLPVMPDLDAILALHGAQFVRCAYRRLLVREPEPHGLAAYRRELLDGTPKIVLLDAIASSKEGRELAVSPPGLARAVRLYRLSRTPLLGALVRRLFAVDGRSEFERRLRAVEEMLYAPRVPDGPGPSVGTPDQCGGDRDVDRRIGTTRSRALRWAQVASENPGLPQCLIEPTGGLEVAIIVVHAADGLLAAPVPNYVAAAMAYGIEVVLAIATRGPAPALAADVRSRLHGLFTLPDTGDDRAAWAYVIRRFPVLTSASILWLANDHALESIGAAGIAQIVGRIRGSAADVISLTEQLALHDQSSQHFLALKAASLSHAAFHNYFNRCGDHESAVPTDELSHVSLASLLRSRSLAVEFLADVPPASVVGRAARSGGNAEASGSRLVGQVRVPDKPVRVALIGPWNLDSNAGRRTQGYVSALWHTDLCVNLHPLRDPLPGRRGLAPTVDCRSFSGDADVVIVALDPGQWEQLLGAEHWAMLARARKVACAWSTQAEHPSPSWRMALEACDVIWAPSRHCADRQRELTALPVEVVPACIGTVPADHDPARHAALRSRLGLPPDQRLIVGCLGDQADLVADDPGSLVQAFSQSTLGSDGWALVVVVASPLEESADGRRLRDLAATVPGVLLRDRRTCGRNIDPWLEVADIYASARRSPGFGWTVARAMAMGRVVVAMDYGGNRDFLDRDCGFPVAYSLRILTEDHDPYCKGDVWAQIDVEAMAAALREAAAAVTGGDGAVARAARQRIEARCSPRAVGDSIRLAVAGLFGDGA